MQRLRAYLIILIIAGLAIRIAWLAIAPIVPYAIGGTIAVCAAGALFYRKRHW